MYIYIHVYIMDTHVLLYIYMYIYALWPILMHCFPQSMVYLIRLENAYCMGIPTNRMLYPVHLYVHVYRGNTEYVCTIHFLTHYDIIIIMCIYMYIMPNTINHIYTYYTLLNNING